MMDFFYFFYARFNPKNDFSAKVGINSLIRFIIRLAANAMLPFYFRVTGRWRRNQLQQNRRKSDGGIVVSLTSFPGRIERVWIVVETLLRQTRKPDQIILWLSRDQFPDINHLPQSLLRLRRRGLRIELRGGDLRSHKKYYYVKREFPSSVVVLVDDDIFYPKGMLDELVTASEVFPGKVVCRFTKRIKWSSNHELDKYLNWPKVNDGMLGADYFFGSGGGVLIPPTSIDSDVLNSQVFSEICPTADDIWLNAMCRLVSIEMVSLNKRFLLLPVMQRDKTDLSSINNGLLRNDEQLRLVRDYCLLSHGRDPFRFD
jgi:hypothetical protein